MFGYYVCKNFTGLEALQCKIAASDTVSEQIVTSICKLCTFMSILLQLLQLGAELAEKIVVQHHECMLTNTHFCGVQPHLRTTTYDQAFVFRHMLNDVDWPRPNSASDENRIWNRTESLNRKKPQPELDGQSFTWKFLLWEHKAFQAETIQTCTWVVQRRGEAKKDANSKIAGWNVCHHIDCNQTGTCFS